MLKQWIRSGYTLLVDQPYREGKILSGRYEIVKVLGVGSYGISYLCNDQCNNQLCVVKQVKPSIKKTHKGWRAYQSETSILKSINHPSIPKYYNRFEFDKNLFFSMEYIAGGNLEQLLFEQRVKFNEYQSLSILLQLVDIVAVLHGKQIIHRDIRIPNIILDNKRLYLIDFGLARHLGDLGDEEKNFCMEKQLQREMNVRSDFYALGHLLLFLLYSTYEEQTDTEKSWEDELSLAAPVKSMIRKMLQIDPPYADVTELRQELWWALTLQRHK